MIAGGAFLTTLFAFIFTDITKKDYSGFATWWDGVGLPLFAIVFVLYFMIAGAIGLFHMPATAEY